MIRFANRSYVEWLGLPRDEIVGRSLKEVRGERHYDEVILFSDRALAGETVINEGEWRLDDGSHIHYRATRVPDFGADGAVQGYFAVVDDLTEHHHREAELRHSQKMEVVGQLTGGIAHEFNNLLMIVLGNIELLEEKLPAGDDLRWMVTAAKTGVLRGADLTQRLLAFSRRQTLQVARVDLCELVRDTTDMLRRSLGETITIDIEAAADLWPTVADASQLQAALLNFAVNSRDAMPRGGAIVVRTANAIVDDATAVRHETKSGDYVVLEVRDSGCGMAPEVIERAFEPFYTTKRVGHGTGLGLSMVYGFARQSGGFVEIESEPDHGTTVRLYLPRAVGEQGSETPEYCRPAPVPRGSGMILVVEDDKEVRDLVTGLLNELGYRVVEAADGEAALSMIAAHDDIDLLFTDVILPGGMSGPQIAREALRRRPELKVLFTSGYAEQAMDELDSEEASAGFIPKPYRKARLAQALAEALR